MKKAVFLGLMLAFLAGSGLAKANYWHEDFESGLGVWNSTEQLIAGSDISTAQALSPTHSLNMIYTDEADRNLTVPLADFWVNISIYDVDDRSNNDFFDITCYEASNSANIRGIAAYIDPTSGNWSFYSIEDSTILDTPTPYINETWQNISVKFENATNNYTLASFYIENIYNGYIEAGSDGFFADCDSPANKSLFISLFGSNNDGFTYFDEVYAYDEVPGPCVQNWTCTEWGECVRGYQNRVCTDENQCGNETGEPAERQLCLTPVPNATMNITQACCPISTLRCFDNSTLVEIWNTSAGVAYAYQDCPFGCDNSTLSCAPKKFEQNLYLLGIFIFIVVAGLIAIKWAKR